MSNKLNKLTGGFGALLGLLIILTPFQLVPVCQKLLELKSGSMVHMRCHYTGQAEVYLGILTLVTSIMLMFSRSSGRRYLGLVLAALGVVVILIPTHLGIGICMSPMDCHTTAKFLYVFGGLLAVNGLTAAFVRESRDLNNDTKGTVAPLN